MEGYKLIPLMDFHRKDLIRWYPKHTVTGYAISVPGVCEDNPVPILKGAWTPSHFARELPDRYIIARYSSYLHVYKEGGRIVESLEDH